MYPVQRGLKEEYPSLYFCLSSLVPCKTPPDFPITRKTAEIWKKTRVSVIIMYVFLTASISLGATALLKTDQPFLAAGAMLSFVAFVYASFKLFNYSSILVHTPHPTFQLLDDPLSRITYQLEHQVEGARTPNSASYNEQTEGLETPKNPPPSPDRTEGEPIFPPC